MHKLSMSNKGTLYGLYQQNVLKYINQILHDIDMILNNQYELFEYWKRLISDIRAKSRANIK